MYWINPSGDPTNSPIQVRCVRQNKQTCVSAKKEIYAGSTKSSGEQIWFQHTSNLGEVSYPFV